MDELRKTFIAAMLFGFISGAVSVSIPLFLDGQGFSLANIGSILAAATLIGGLIGIYIGAHSDVFGRKNLMSALGGLWAACTFMLIPFKTVLAYVLSQSGSKFSSGTLWNLFLSRITDLTKRNERGTYLGYYSAAFGLAFAFAHVATGYIFTNYGADSVFLFITIISILAAGFILSFKEVAKRREKLHLSLKTLKTRNGAVNAVVSFLNGAQRSIIYGFALYLFLAHAYGFTAEEIGFYSFIFLTVWGTSNYFVGKFTDRIGSINTLLYGSIINASIWVAAAYLQQWEIFFFLMVTENLTYPFYGVSTIKISSMLAHHENVGRDITIFGYFDILGAMAGVFIAGILAEASFSYVFLMRAATIISSALIAYFFINLDEGEQAVPN
jgi:MFS family permease